MTADRYYYVVTCDPSSGQRLRANFDALPLKVVEQGGIYLIDADCLQLGFEDFASADNLLRTMEGALRAAGSPISNNVHIGGAWFQEPNNGPLRKSSRAMASISIGAMIAPVPSVSVDGVVQPKPRSLAARIMDWLPTAGTDERALLLMMIKGDPDWRDIHVVIEIFDKLKLPSESDLRQEIKRIRWTAGNWHAVGVNARHYDKGQPAPKSPPTLQEARSFLSNIIKRWFEENIPP